jgi:hypothetical protein
LTHLSARQALLRDQRALGRDYGSAYHHTCQQLWWVASYWDRYEALFGTRERVELLNESSGNFWFSTQKMLFDYVLLGVCRLTDPPNFGKKQNLTVRRLYDLEPGRYKAELRKLVERAESRAAFARDWRNRRIAHNDLEYTTSTATRLAQATRDRVRDSINAIHDVLRWVTIRNFDSDMSYLPLGEDDANELMIVIDDGLSARKARRAALDRRDYKNAASPPYRWLNGPRTTWHEPSRELRVPKGR